MSIDSKRDVNEEAEGYELGAKKCAAEFAGAGLNNFHGAKPQINT